MLKNVLCLAHFHHAIERLQAKENALNVCLGTCKSAIENYCFKLLFHSSQKPTRKLAASAFKYCVWISESSRSELAFAMSGKELNSHLLHIFYRQISLVGSRPTQRGLAIRSDFYTHPIFITLITNTFFKCFSSVTQPYLAYILRSYSSERVSLP